MEFGDLYLPVANQFNDPFEASPRFGIPRNDDGSVNVDVYIEKLRTIYGPRWGWSAQKIAETEVHLRAINSTGMLELQTIAQEAEWWNRLRTDFPMCCLTSDRSNVLMWSYYAGAHTGVCLHFDATIGPFGAAFKVWYEDEYPILPVPLAGLDSGSVIRQCLLIKAKPWQHECEYRLIDMPNYDRGGGQTFPRALDPPVTAGRNGQLIKFHRRHVVGVSCGALMRDDAIETLARLCWDHSPRLPLWRAKIAKYEFKLTFEEIRG